MLTQSMHLDDDGSDILGGGLSWWRESYPCGAAPWYSILRTRKECYRELESATCFSRGNVRPSFFVGSVPELQYHGRSSSQSRCVI